MTAAPKTPPVMRPALQTVARAAWPNGPSPATDWIAYSWSREPGWKARAAGGTKMVQALSRAAAARTASASG